MLSAKPTFAIAVVPGTVTPAGGAVEGAATVGVRREEAAEIIATTPEIV